MSEEDPEESPEDDGVTLEPAGRADDRSEGGDEDATILSPAPADGSRKTAPIVHRPAKPGGAGSLSAPSKSGGREIVRERGHYTEGGEVARGGMGRILEAEDHGLERTVAMKVMLDDSNVSGQARARFLREAKVLARLEHPNIVPIHELGRDEQGRQYYTMKLVKGRTLQEILDGLRGGDEGVVQDYGLDRLLGLFRKICDAMAFAHHRQVVHRDLKPENVMVGEFGEVLVMDWGLAKILNEEEIVEATEHEEKGKGDLTLDGAVMGTPRYMSPEQAAGKVDEIDARSDVFSLGGILYAILTLQPPVSGSSVKEVLANIRSGRITPPDSFSTIMTEHRERSADGGRIESTETSYRLRHCPGGRAPSAISAVAMRALAVKPEARYATVGELARDIDRFQGGYATSVESLSATGQFWLLIKRNPGVSSAVLIAMLVIGVLSSVFVIKLMASRAEAQAKADEANDNARLALQESRKAREEARTAEAVSGFLTGMLEDADPLAIHGKARVGEGRLGPDVTVREIILKSINKLEGALNESPEIRAKVLDAIGNVGGSLSMYAEAEPLLREALLIRQQRLGEEHPDTAATLRALGMLSFYRGRSEDAVDMLRRALEIVEKAHGRDHPAVSDVLLDLGLVSSLYERLPEARAQLVRAREIRQRHYGRQSREALAPSIALVIVDILDDRLDPAAIQELLASWGAIGSDEPLAAIGGKVLQARMLNGINPDASDRLMRQLDAEAGELLGTNHVVVNLTRAFHGDLLLHADRPAEAREVFQRALKSLSSDVGLRFIAAAPLYIGLGKAERRLENRAAAVVNWRKFLDLFEGERPAMKLNNHAGSGYRWVMFRLIQDLMLMEKYAEAEAEARRMAQLHEAGNSAFGAQVHYHRVNVLLKQHGLRTIPHTLNQERPGVGWRVEQAARLARTIELMRERSGERSDEDQRFLDWCEREAVKHFKAGVDLGFRDRGKLRRHRLYQSLRVLDEYDDIVARIPKK